MARRTKSADLCEVSGCNKPRAWICTKLWGKGGTICTCDEHKPDASKRSESLRHLPSFYDIKPIRKTNES